MSAYSVHPGLVLTNLGQYLVTPGSFLSYILLVFVWPFSKSVPQARLPGEGLPCVCGLHASAARTATPERRLTARGQARRMWVCSASLQPACVQAALDFPPLQAASYSMGAGSWAPAPSKFRQHTGDLLLIPYSRMLLHSQPLCGTGRSHHSVCGRAAWPGVPVRWLLCRLQAAEAPG